MTKPVVRMESNYALRRPDFAMIVSISIDVDGDVFVPYEE